MHRLALTCLALLLAPAAALAVHPDAANCQDHPLFTRMPGYWIYGCKEAQFDAYKFKVGDTRKPGVESIEGRYTRINYSFDKAAGGAPPSRLQVLRNYQNAIQKLGGKVLWESQSDGRTTLKVARDGTEFWTEVGEYGTSIFLNVIERKAMTQDIVANADAFASDLETTGHAAVYGIYFDTGLAVLKPESAAALAEIAKLMSQKPALKLRVVGHTDAVGQLDANLKLSQARAEATLAALVKEQGVAAARLTAHGVGPLAPVGSNATEEGRAKNRRVELVAW